MLEKLEDYYFSRKYEHLTMVEPGRFKAKAITCFISVFVVFFFCYEIIITKNDDFSKKFETFENGTLGKVLLNKPKEVAVREYKNCTERNVTLSKTALPLTGLLSFPGSGNTWTRHLLQQMTGLATSSMYCDEVLRLNGFPYECLHKSWRKCIVVKAHKPKHKNPLFEKIVFLVRNPYDAVLSLANFISSGHKQIPPLENLQKKSDAKFDNFLRNYKKLVSYITSTFKGPVHVLQYERLKTDMATELRKLAEFLQVNVTARDIGCTVKLQEGHFHRNSTDDNHLKLLKSVYNKDKLLRIHQTAIFTEKRLKKAYGIDVDLRGSIEHQLMKNQ